MTNQQDRVALVTGGTSGIGLATVGLLADRGIRVAVTAADADEVQQVVDDVVAAGGLAIAAPADVTASDQLEQAVATAIEAYGRLDVLVTSAGIQRYGTVPDTDERTWDEVFDVNVKGVFLAARAAIPQLRRQGGAIVVVSSVLAKATQTDVAAYTSSKGALNALVRSMAVDEAPYGIRVNAVCPGSVDTPMLRSSAGLFSAGDADAVDNLVRQWGRSHPLGRVGRPEEVAEVIAFLAGPGAGFVTGTEVFVDGGLLAQIAVALPDAD